MNQFKINEFFNLSFDLASRKDIAERLKSGANIKGANMMILILSMFIASIGLNMNSTAVVIGAMLISPLMGPIMGMGYGIATYDTDVVKKSFQRLGLQIFVCIVSSTIYFSLTPINVASSELLARIEPTIWDVLIALFGGLAGIIGQTRKELGNVIPGVAIATALMPPLCTAGYGLANGEMHFFVGAFYLFFINCFFICLSTFIILKLIRMPIKDYSNIDIHHRNQRLLIILALLVAVPSLYTAYQTVIKLSEEKAVQEFISDQLDSHSRQVVSYDLDRDGGTLHVVLFGTPLGEGEVKAVTEKLQGYDQLGHYTLHLVQSDYRYVTKDGQSPSAQNKLLRDELKKYKELNKAYYPAYEAIKSSVERSAYYTKTGKALFPEVVSMEVSFAGKVDGTKDTEKVAEDIAVGKMFVTVYVSAPMKASDAKRLQDWIQSERTEPVVVTIELQENSNVVTDSGVRPD